MIKKVFIAQKGKDYAVSNSIFDTDWSVELFSAMVEISGANGTVVNIYVARNDSDIVSTARLASAVLNYFGVPEDSGANIIEEE